MICIILGAFGAHAIKAMLGPSDVAIWKLGTEYQFLHGITIIVLSLFAHISPNLIKWSYRALLGGVFLFSGSLYFLTFRSVLENGFIKFIGPLTPIGGTLFIIGWILFLIAIIKHKS